MKTCRVFLVGEGVSDIGDLIHPPRYRKNREGFLQPILRKLVGDRLQLEFEGRQLRTIAKTKVKTPGALLTRHAAQAYVLAAHEKCSAVVFCTDVDRAQGQKRSMREAAKRIATLSAGITKGFSDAEESYGEKLAMVVATPCRMIESWALGDPAALKELTGSDVEPSDVAAPEEAWGDDEDADSKHPKCTLARILGSEPDFAAIAEAASIDALETSCRTSFKPFADAVRAAVTECSSD